MEISTVAPESTNSGDENLPKLLLPAIVIFLLCLGMVSAMVFATGNGNGNDKCNGNGNGNGNGNDKCNGNGNDNGNGNGNGNGNDTSTGNGNGNGSGNVTGNGNVNGNGNGNENVDDNGKDKSGSSIGGSENGPGKNAGDNKADNLNGSSDATGKNKTDVVQQIVSTPAVQASVMALLITYPAAVSSDPVSPGWWSVVEWNAETLFKRIFFLSGSIGEKIKRKDVLRNRKRREMYYFIVNFPFSHFRRITRMVGVGPNEGSWHLRILEKMGFIKSEHFGRYLIYHANNSGPVGSRDRPASLIPNSNATRILEYLLRNPGVKITNVTRALMMNRNTVSYHVKRMQTSGLVERVERNGLRLASTGYVHGEGLAPVIANPMAPRIDVTLPNVDSSA